MTPITIITIAAAFICVSALVGGVALLFRGHQGSAAEDRLDVLTGVATKKGNNPQAEGSLLAQTIEDSRVSVATRFLERFGNINQFLEQADTGLTASRFLAVTAGLAGVGLVAPLFIKMPLPLYPVTSLTLGMIPFGFVFLKRRRRLSAFAKQLPDALELVSRALRAGHSLGAAFSLVATECADPIRREFARCYDEQNYGKPLEEALEAMTTRVPNVDLRFFATAVILQRQTGGDLAEILDKIGYLIRERFKIWGQVQALTGEGRLSGIVLMALPPVLFVVMYRMNPDYSLVLFRDPLGQKMLTVAVIMQILGAIVIRKIVNIKV